MAATGNPGVNCAPKPTMANLPVEGVAVVTDSNHLSNQELRTVAACEQALNDLVLTNLHLAGCVGCRQKLFDLRYIPRLIEGSPVINELSNNNDRDKVATHFVMSNSCAEELKELQVFERLVVRVWKSGLVPADAAEKRSAWMDCLLRFLSTSQMMQYVCVSLCSILCGVLTISRAYVESNSTPGGSPHSVTAFNGSSHMGLLVGAILAATGVAGFLYGIFKRSYSAAAATQDSSPQAGKN